MIVVSAIAAARSSTSIATERRRSAAWLAADQPASIMQPRVKNRLPDAITQPTWIMRICRYQEAIACHLRGIALEYAEGRVHACRSRAEPRPKNCRGVVASDVPV